MKNPLPQNRKYVLSEVRKDVLSSDTSYGGFYRQGDPPKDGRQPGILASIRRVRRQRRKEVEL